MITAITQSQTIGVTPDNWADTVDFNQFNPIDGVLVSAVLTMTGTLEASASIENLAPVAATVDLGVAASIGASSPALGNLGTVAPDAVAAVHLPAFQGTFSGIPDFTAASSKTIGTLVASETVSTPLPPGTAAAGPSPIVGTGTIAVNVTASAVSTFKANGNYALLLHASSGATLSMNYVAVTPPPAGSAGSSDGGADGITSLFTYDPLFPPMVTLGTTAPQTVTFAPKTTGWTDSAAISRFDPSLGTLDQVIVTVGDSIGGTFSIENLDPGATPVAMTETARLTAELPGTAKDLTATSSNGIAFNLGGYDGTVDFTGASGATAAIPDPSVSAATYFPGYVYPFKDISNTATLTSRDALAAYTGTGTVSVPVLTGGGSVLTGPGNLEAVSTQTTGGTLTVSYVYTPAASVPPPADPPAVPLFDPDLDGGGAVCARLVGSWFAPPDLTFVGPAAAGDVTVVSAAADETFVISPGANADITGFSLADGDRLDVTRLLHGGGIGDDLANVGLYVSVTGSTTDAAGLIDTSLSINGPSGSASLTLSGTAAISVLDLLQNNALIVPSY